MDEIVDQLERAFDGDPWHGPSLMANLDGVGHREAAERPVEGVHSIWELVLHVTGWTGVVTRRMRGEWLEVADEGDFPAIQAVSEPAWKAALAMARAAHDELCRVTRGFDKKRLNERIGNTTYYMLLHGQAQHVAYHSGQIAMLKRVGAVRQ